MFGVAPTSIHEAWLAGNALPSLFWNMYIHLERCVFKEIITLLRASPGISLCLDVLHAFLSFLILLQSTVITSDKRHIRKRRGTRSPEPPGTRERGRLCSSSASSVVSLGPDEHVWPDPIFYSSPVEVACCFALQQKAASSGNGCVAWSGRHIHLHGHTFHGHWINPGTLLSG